MGTFSKSLDPQQQNWTTWEGELYSVREGLRHFRGIVAGCRVVIGTDRLNNLLVNSSAELRQPNKILRWLMEMEGLCLCKWAFTPGAANQFADMASRNPSDRDEVMGNLVARSELPQTLQEAFIQVVGWFGIGGPR